MSNRTRFVFAMGVAVASVLALTSCSLFGPNRGPDGQVTDTSVVGSTTMLVGDCFTFVDGSNLTEVTLPPCTETHAYIVIGKGELASATIDSAGGVQNAVSVACADAFTAFKAAAPEGTKPTQEFVVATEDRDGKQVTLYSCVATDAAAAPAA